MALLAGSQVAGRASFQFDVQGTRQEPRIAGKAVAEALLFRDVPLGPGSVAFTHYRDAVDLDVTVRQGSQRLRLQLGPSPDRTLRLDLALADADLAPLFRLAGIEGLRSHGGPGHRTHSDGRESRRLRGGRRGGNLQRAPAPAGGRTVGKQGTGGDILEGRRCVAPPGTAPFPGSRPGHPRHGDRQGSHRPSGHGAGSPGGPLPVSPGGETRGRVRRGRTCVSAEPCRRRSSRER